MASIEKLITAELPLGSGTNEIKKHIKRHFYRCDNKVRSPVYDPPSWDSFYEVNACKEQDGSSFASISVLYSFSNGKLTKVHVVPMRLDSKSRIRLAVT